MNGALTLHPKAAAAGVTSGLGVIVVWLLGLAHVTVEPVVAGALVGVVSSIGAWLAPIVQAEAAKLTRP